MIEVKRYAHRREAFSYFRWDGSSIEEVRKILPYIDIHAGHFPGDGNLFNLMMYLSALEDHPFEVEIGDYLAYMQKASQPLYVSRDNFEHLYEEIK